MKTDTHVGKVLLLSRNAPKYYRELADIIEMILSKRTTPLVLTEHLRKQAAEFEEALTAIGIPVPDSTPVQFSLLDGTELSHA